MGKIVSFFRHRADDPGVALNFEVTIQGAGKVEIDLYSRGQLSESEAQRLCAQKLSSDEAFTSLKNSLIKLIEDAGGGILVQLFRTGAGIFTEVCTVESHGYVLPKRFLNLTLGSPARFEKLKFTEQRPTPLGSRWLIPVDPAAETELEAFLGHVRWLSPDVESLVLDSLTRPSLETRVADLERQAGKSIGEPGSSPLASLLRKIPGFNKISFPGWMQRPLQLVLGVLALALLLFLNTLLIERVVRQVVVAELAELKTGKGPDIFKPTNPKKTESRDKGSIDEPGNQDFADAVKDFDKMLAVFPEGTPEAKLYASHFKDVSPGAALRSEPFAWGLVKLLALEQGMRVTDKVLTGVEERSATKQQLKELLPKLSADGVAFLAAVTCSSFEENRQKDIAGLPAVAGDSFAERVDLPAACKGAEDRINLVAAIETLTARLKTRLGEGS